MPMMVCRNPLSDFCRAALGAFCGLEIALASPLAAAPLSKCRLNMQSDYVSPADRSIPDDVRQEVRLRVLIDVLDDADIVFRGRLASRRYLSDLSQTPVPLILEVYENVVVLKGHMPLTEKDGRVNLIRVKPCNGGCPLSVLPEVDHQTAGREQVVLAMNNTLEDPAEARDWGTDKVVYSGRIDALNGPCDPFQINQGAALHLISEPQEMDRLRRAYPRRTAEEKSRDGQAIMRKLLGRP